MENARLHEDRRGRARAGTRPGAGPPGAARLLAAASCREVPGYEFFAYYESAQEVGGDYYDFIPLPRRRLAVMLGDVAGKGVPAALLDGQAQLPTRASAC